MTLSGPPSSPSPAHALQCFTTPTTSPPTPQPNSFTAGGNTKTRLVALYTSPNTTAPECPITVQTKQQLPQSAYRAPRVCLVDLQHHSLPHEPDTPDGRARYEEQVQVWHQKHGPYPQAKPDKYRPYPLMPGMQHVSTGACFNCGGKHGDKRHFQCNCPVKDLPGSLPTPE
jgi:hypothetical protein